MTDFPARQRPIDDNDRQTILLPIVGGLTELITGRPGLFVDRPGFINGPPPDTLLAQAVQSVSRLNCRIWASNDKEQYSQNVNQQNANLCGPYLDSLGESPEDGAIGPLFEGGQCLGVRYAFTRRGTLPSPPTDSGNVTTIRRGPLRISTELQPGDFCAPGTGTYRRWTLIGSDGSSGLWAGCDATLEIISVVPLDGGPNNCGDPAPVIQPPSTVRPVVPPSPTITVSLPGLGDVEVNVNLDPDGNPIICVPDLDVCVTIPFDVDVTGGGGGGGGGGAPPGDVGDPGGTEGTGDGGEAEGEAPPGSVLTGLRIDIVEVPASAREYSPGVYRAVCYAFLGTDEGLDLDPAGALLETGQFIFAEKDNLTKWKVVANVGFNLNITPYYREVE